MARLGCGLLEWFVVVLLQRSGEWVGISLNCVHIQVWWGPFQFGCGWLAIVRQVHKGGCLEGLKQSCVCLDGCRVLVLKLSNLCGLISVIIVILQGLYFATILAQCMASGTVGDLWGVHMWCHFVLGIALLLVTQILCLFGGGSLNCCLNTMTQCNCNLTWWSSN